MRSGISKTLRIVAGGALMFCSAFVGLSQKLDENCTVSVLNRTVRVNPDGSWVLPNIPANFGQVKARATCIKNGVTTFGESGFFTVAANGAVNLPPIILGSATQIPVSLKLAPVPISFTGLGQISQLIVTATYPDNSTQDVTPGSAGTNYTTSNPAIATVSANGLVTAVASGTVVIQATNDGATGIITASVVLSSTDSDGDGIPDDAEIRLGLDPHNAVDAQEDLDRDGLTNREEYQLGTDIRKSDTDGDSLSDGDEVNKHKTSPLLFDTDGDFIPDGLEIQTGTNPLDKNSYDLNKATASSVVKPSAFVLTTSLLFPVATQQLSWKANLIDGKTILDLTTDPRTNYTSSDTLICNFGAQKGLVFAGNPGPCTITLSNSTLTATASGTVQSFTPTALSFVDIPGFANNVDVNGNFAYVAAGSTGLQVVNVSDHLHPGVVASRSLPGNANDVVVVGNYAYVAAGNAGLQVVDISNPLAPTVTGSLNTGAVAWDVVVKGTQAYVANGTSGLVIIDVSTPASPVRLGSLSLSGTSKGVDVDTVRQIAAVGLGTNGLAVVNVANAAAPALLGTLAGGDVRDVAISGNFVFLADFSRSFTSVDLTNPATPVLRASTQQSLGGLLQDVVVNGSLAAGADVVFVNGVPMIDVSTPASPQPRIIIDFRNFRDDNGTGIAMDSNFVYLTAERGMTENGVNTGTTRLYIGQYRNIQDNNGIAPTVQITSPSAGTNIIQGSSVTLTAAATDDVGVAAVNFFVNGQLAFTTATAPYQYTFTAPATGSTLIIGATAVDFGNNVGQASNVTLNLIPDPLTTAQGRVVDAQNIPVAGANVVCQGKDVVSAADGAFSVTGLSTVLGPIQCSATATIAGVLQSGISASIEPARGGITDVGTIVLSPLGSRGQDFWLAFPSALQNSTTQVFIVSDGTAHYNVSNSSLGLNVSGTVTAQSPAIVAIPSSFAITSNQTVENKGIHVMADADVAVFFFYPTNVTSDSYLGIPTASLGTEYFGLSYPQNIAGQPSHLAVIASEDATHLTISNACGAASPLTATLSKGQTYQLQCSTDVSGSHVVSDKPVAVVAGVSCVNIPAAVGACDVISEMMLPVGRLWGTETYSAPLPGGGFDVYRVMAARNGTTVTVDRGGGNVQTVNLNQGQFQELQFKSGAHFTSNQPILVMQYMTGFNNTGIGDPFSMQLVPTTNFGQSFRFYAPPNQGWTNRTIIIAPNSAVGLVQLNGNVVSGFTALPGGAYQYAVVAVSDGQNVATSPQPITVYSIGFQQAGSYGTPTRF
jgi:hypothetical protein